MDPDQMPRSNQQSQWGVAGDQQPAPGYQQDVGYYAQSAAPSQGSGYGYPQQPQQPYAQPYQEPSYSQQPYGSRSGNPGSYPNAYPYQQHPDAYPYRSYPDADANRSNMDSGSVPYAQQPVGMPPYGQPYPSYRSQAPYHGGPLQQASPLGSSQAYPYPGQTAEPPKKMALGITSIVIGAVALLTAFIPIVNNLSFFLGLIGLILGVIGIIVATRGKAKGKTLAIIGTILCVVACAAVLIVQAMLASAVDEISASLDELTPSMVSSSGSAAQSSSGRSSASGTATSSSASRSASSSARSAASEYADLPIGDSISLSDGTRVTVNSVTGGLVAYDGSPITCVNVTYDNDGSKSVSFNPYDWSGEDAQGARRSQAFYMDGENELSSGSLAPGGTVTGNIYFEGSLSKVVYKPNMFLDDEATWLVP